MDTYQVTLRFTEPLLGTVPLDKHIYADFIVEDAPDEEAIDEELGTVPESDDKGKTGFHQMEDGTPFLYDYVIKGFLKDACGMLRRVRGSASKALTAYRKVIDGLVFVEPRQIPLVLPDGEVLSELSRPLRAQTAQGERVALATSETCPPGTMLRFDLFVLGQVDPDLLKEWFDYGRLRGLGQWRSASYGRFSYQIEHLTL